jgi:DNA-binding XRE family transcriptional regulator
MFSRPRLAYPASYVKALMEPANISDENGQGALGRALRGLRQQAGITQEELGARVGIDPTYISRVEGGRINLRWGTLQRFLRALDATLADLAVEVERQRWPKS